MEVMKVFEIFPYSRCINFLEDERRVLSIEARIYELSELDKRKVRCAIEVAVLTDGVAVFPAGYYCGSLKTYVSDLGYKYSCCGNAFDLVVIV
jgi:hypothetical protein